MKIFKINVINKYKGISYLLKFSWTTDKRYILYQIVLQGLLAAVPLCDTIIPKFIIDELTGDKNVSTLCLWISLMIAINIIGNFGIDTLNGKIMKIKGSLFTKFQTIMAEKLAKSDYINLESPTFLDARAKAEQFIYANGHGFGVVLDNFFKIIGETITVLGIAGIILLLSPIIFIGFVGILIITGLIDSKVEEQYIKWDLEKATIERRSSFFLDLIGNADYGKDIRLYGLQKWIVDIIHNHLLSAEAFYARQISLSVKKEHLSTGIRIFFKAVSYVYLAHRVLIKTIGIGDFTMYIAALLSFSSSVKALSNSIVQIRQFSGYYDALIIYMNAPQKMHEGKAIPVDLDHQVIEFHNVSFTYPGQEKPTIRNISFRINRGEKLSIVGENGAGKSTLIKLLCRLYDTTDGKITLDGIDIKDIDYDQYMGLISAVFQDYKLFPCSIEENITFTQTQDCKEKAIQHIVEKVGLSNTVSRYPKGNRTYVHKLFEEDGIEPSGGEGQKIAIARAIYKNGDIMILDEPTAALDPRAESQIYQNFASITENKTTIFISHRLASCSFCDRIMFLEDGEIVEYGTHEELMKLNGKYKELYELQAKYYQNKAE